MATTTDLSTLKINYLTQEQFDTALTNNQIESNELYFTPMANVGTVTSVGITAGTGISVSNSPITSSGNITVGHSNSVAAGTVGTSSATSGSTVDVPYITYDAQGHITATGTHVHTVSTTDTKNTAGSTDTSSKIYLIGATSQAANPQTYSHDTAYVGTDGCLYSGGTKVLTAHQSVTDNNPTLAWSTTSTVATIGSTEIKVTMPANPNTDAKVTQTATTTNATYELLFSVTADNTTRTEGAQKTSTLTYNPSTKALVTGGTINGFTLGTASAKGVDTSMTATSTSINLLPPRQ